MPQNPGWYGNMPKQVSQVLTCYPPLYLTWHTAQFNTNNYIKTEAQINQKGNSQPQAPDSGSGSGSGSVIDFTNIKLKPGILSWVDVF